MRILVSILFLTGTLLTANAQTSVLSGTVFAGTGLGISGVNVNARLEKGGFSSTKSSDEGKFTLNLKPGIYSLEFSSPGMLTVNISEYLLVNVPGKGMTLDVVMFGSMKHEPCGYSGGDCLPAIKMIEGYKLVYSPTIKTIRDNFFPEIRPKE